MQRIFLTYYSVFVENIPRDARSEWSRLENSRFHISLSRVPLFLHTLSLNSLMYQTRTLSFQAMYTSGNTVTVCFFLVTHIKMAKSQEPKISEWNGFGFVVYFRCWYLRLCHCRVGNRDIENGKSDTVPLNARKAHGGSRGMPPLILNFSPRCRWVAQLTPLQALPPGKNAGTHWTRGWIGLGTGRHVLHKGRTSCRCRGSKPVSSSS
jgi:hypothetical protein